VTTTPEHLMTPADVEAKFGIPRRQVSDWLYRQQLVAVDYARGRGRSGRTPLVRPADVAVLAGENASRHADEAPRVDLATFDM
jgi:hypothetical protein